LPYQPEAWGRPMNEFQSGVLTPQSGTNEVPPAFQALRWLVSLLQLVALAMIIAPGLATVASRQFGFEGVVPSAPVRAAGVGLFVAMTIVRFLLPGGRRRYRAEQAFTEVASSTGGTFSLEKRRIGKSGWSGGPTAKWLIQDTSVTLEVSQSNQSATTRFSAQFATSRELRFTVLPRNLLTRVLTMPKFVAMIQAGVPQSTGSVTDEQRARALKEIGLLAGAEVKLGDPLLDEKIIVKSNDGDLARYVLTASGVSERMNALNALRKTWTLSLFTAEGGAATQLTLDLPGSETDPAALKAAKELVEAVLASLRQNDVLASGHDGRRAAR
jgi:hypothetical protein